LYQFRNSSQLAHEQKDLDNGEHTKRPVEPEEDEELDLEDVETETKDKEAVSAVPWYLQVDSPQRAPEPISERQKIPDLPEAPPPLLEPLLKQVSIDLGMDDLSLLDLRKLDPPPALGANLIMIIGTARSEKHLHVSADRLCRWLRSNYKLRPDADGLLGRNELKLKLKRKAKRAKLMGSAEENADDGVRTGWVCVDIGVVEGGDVVAESPKHKDFVGFGRRTDGVRIVIQLLTEEKREEIDLERLWEGILRRGGQADIESAQDNEQPSPAIVAPDVPTSTKVSTRSISGSLGQSREMHTSSRRLATEQQSLSAQELCPLPSPERLEFDGIKHAAMLDIDSGNFEKAKNDLVSHSEHVPALRDDGWRKLFLYLMKTHIQKIPEDQAVEELTRENGEFLPYFYGAIPTFPTTNDIESKIWMYCFAREIGHPKYHLGTMLHMFREIQGCGIPISMDSFMSLLRSVLRPICQERKLGLSPQAIDAALEILRVMQDQGLEILNEDMLVELQELTGHNAPQYADEPKYHKETYDLLCRRMSSIQRRLHLLMMKLPLPPFRDESRMRLLNLHAQAEHWLEFWDVFRMAPRADAPQSPEIYAFMFACVANTGNQRACMTVLRNWASEMDRENPPIKLEGDLGQAVKACLRIADPKIEEDAESSSDLEGEWVTIWRRCY
jgi:hypothetical protein